MISNKITNIKLLFFFTAIFQIVNADAEDKISKNEEANATAIPSGKDQSTVELEEITVIGTKRDQNIQDAVQSLSVLEERDTIGMVNSLDGLKRMSNISFNSASQLPVVRGLDGNGVAFGGFGAVSGARPRMTNYIDGVPRSFSASPDGQSSYWDMKQTEVYRGSQSTQLGRNAIAGAIVQTSNDPVFKDEYALQFGIRDEDFTYENAFMANKTLGDQLAVRLAGQYNSGENFVEYQLADPLLEDNARKKADDYEFSRLRFKTLFAPTDIPELTLKLTVDTERNAANNALDTVSLNQGDKRILTDPLGYSYLRTTNDVFSLTGNYLFNNEWSLDIILSHQRVKSNYGPPPETRAATAKYLDFTANVHETTVEPKVTYHSSGSRTQAVLGFFYLTRNRNDFGKPGTAFDFVAEDQASTVSLFADSTIQIAEDWDLLLGGRLEEDKQKRDFSGFGGSLTFGFDQQADVFLPKAGLTYHVTDDASVSALYYEGYNAGGGGVTFDPPVQTYLYDKERSRTAELLTRTAWLDGKLTANANLFYTHLYDAQLFGFNPNGQSGTVQNAERAHTYGLELGVNYQPNETDRIYANLGLLETEIDNFGGVKNNVNNGNQFGVAPNVTMSIGGFKELLPNFTVGGDVYFTDARFSTYENKAIDKMPSYTTANINARYRYKMAMVTGYVNNLFGKYAALQISNAEGTGQVIPPRTMGINLRLDF